MQPRVGPGDTKQKPRVANGSQTLERKYVLASILAAAGNDVDCVYAEAVLKRRVMTNQGEACAQYAG